MNWRYNEFQQVGKDYSQKSEVDVYDHSHSQFRNLEKESRDLLSLLGVSGKDILVDFGCGTGVFAIEASKKCKQVYAVDISKEMLKYSSEKARSQNISNIEFVHSGFLNFDPKPGSVNFITSTFSFHHLPDFWKKVALDRMNMMLTEGGTLYIKDVVIEDSDPAENINRFIAEQERLGGDFLKEDAEMHFKEEFSTFDWILESLIERAGFQILFKSMEAGLIATYKCRKINR